mgnify:FL=1|tara:strand:+ start:1337 stop:1618 length:282 start_codon:yes stop_codon:yes gene_type:complete
MGCPLDIPSDTHLKGGKTIEIEQSLRCWADYFGIPFGTFKNRAYQHGIKAPFTESKARLVAAYAAGKALKARGNTALAGKRNYTNIMEKLSND